MLVMASFMGKLCVDVKMFNDVSLQAKVASLYDCKYE